jgi:hypothetical protein
MNCLWNNCHLVLYTITLLLLKVLMPWALGFFTYSSIQEHLTSIVGLEGNKSYNRQSLQLKNNGFWIWRGLATANPSKISLSQLWTMSTFHMIRALLTETMFYVTLYVRGDYEFSIRLQNSSCGACMWISLRNQLVTTTTASAATSTTASSSRVADAQCCWPVALLLDFY